jgi:hypothetical protein
LCRSIYGVNFLSKLINNPLNHKAVDDNDNGNPKTLKDLSQYYFRVLYSSPTHLAKHLSIRDIIDVEIERSNSRFFELIIAVRTCSSPLLNGLTNIPHRLLASQGRGRFNVYVFCHPSCFVFTVLFVLELVFDDRRYLKTTTNWFRFGLVVVVVVVVVVGCAVVDLCVCVGVCRSKRSNTYGMTLGRIFNMFRPSG